MPKTSAQARPANLRRTLRRLLSYMGHAKFSLLAVGVLASVAAIASLAGTYMVRPIVNGLAAGGEELLTKQVLFTAVIYAAGVLSALGYSQIMVRAAQRVVSDIRRDLFAHIQTLPLSYFDSTRSGDIMSFFTNDVDTVSEALNNSFANVIQATIQVIGTTAMLIILNWQLTIITLACDVAIVLYARYSGARSKRFFAAQQASLGDLDGYVEEMVSGQKVIKVFNHEQANVAGFDTRNQELRRTGGAAQAYANSMVPMTVVIGYVNYAIVAVAGGMLCIKGLADVGALASYLVFVRQAAMPINQFTQLGNFLLNALAGAEHLFAAMDLKPEVDEGCVELVQTGDAAWAATVSTICLMSLALCGSRISRNSSNLTVRSSTPRHFFTISAKMNSMNRVYPMMLQASASLMRFSAACPMTWRLSRPMPQPLRRPFWAIESCA